MTFDYRAGTANIKSNPVMTKAKVVSAFNTMAPLFDIGGFNEIKGLNYVAALIALKLKGFATYQAPSMMGQNPVAWRTSIFEKMETGYKRCHLPGLGSPARGLTYVIAKHKATGKLVCHVETHFIHQAWTSHHERQSRWNEHLKVLREEVTKLAARVDVLTLSGDFNRNAWYGLDLGGRYARTTGGTFGKATYDYLYVIGDGVQVSDGHTISTTSDHKGLWATVSSVEVVKPATTVPAEWIEKARAEGLVNVEDAAIASTFTGLPFEACCALLAKESGGRNIYGHDKGGYFTVTGDKQVTEESFNEFYRNVVDLKHTSNGVGPCQITYRGHFPIMAARGLKAWLPLDNMRYGFELLLTNYEVNGNDWSKAGTAYNAGSLRNGVNDYGRELAALVVHYRDLFSANTNTPEEGMPVATSASKIIQLAKSQVGYHEGRSNGHWNNYEKYAPQVPGLEWAQNQAWCATFVSWLALKSGLSALYPRTASCDVAGAWFKSRGRWSEYPAIGAQVFFGHPSDLNHTGIVTDYDGTYVWTVEGNTNTNGSREGDGVYAKKRSRRDAGLIGYGYPKFPEGIKSADPRFQNDKPKPAPAPKPAPPKHRKTPFQVAVDALLAKSKINRVELAQAVLIDAKSTARPVNVPAIEKSLAALKEVK